MFSKIKNFFKGVGDIVSGSFKAALNTIGLYRRGTPELLESYSESPWIYAPVARISKDAADTVWRTYEPTSRSIPIGDRSVRALRRKGTKGLVKENLPLVQALANKEVRETDHPVLDLLENPNPLMSAEEFMTASVAGMLLAGEVFWWVIPGSRSGQPVEMWAIPASWVTATPGPNRSTFKVQHRRLNKEIPEEFMIWFKDVDPDDPYGRGVGPGRVLGQEIDLDESIAKHLLSFFKRGGTPDMMVGIEDASPDVMDQVRDEYKKGQRGDSAGQAVYFYSGKLNIKQLNPTFKETQLAELRKSSRNASLQVYGMPPEQLGILENANRSTIDASSYLYNKETLLPWIRLFARKIQSDLIPMWQMSNDVIFSFDSPVPEDSEFVLSVMQNAPDVFTVNEHRAMAGHPPLESEEGEELYLPVTYNSGVEPGSDPPETTGEEGNDTEGEESSEEEKALELVEIAKQEFGA